MPILVPKTFLYKNDRLYKIIGQTSVEYKVKEFKQTFFSKFDASVSFEDDMTNDFNSYSKYEYDKSAKLQRIPKDSCPHYEVKGFDVSSNYVKPIPDDEYLDDMHSERYYAVTHNVFNLFLKHVGLEEADDHPSEAVRFYYEALSGNTRGINDEVSQLLANKVKEHD